ncbi:hypothetical protein [Methylobacter psychrophilus]|uniref:hypothetical protein n=1 Tax=Methylobacter psychrophilus TaxID=96941 RepID=UPI0021D4DC1C|nr:hypothetical protein [Methylobacter psychrophilus]
MTIIKKRGSKEITKYIKDNFGLMLTELSKSEPAVKNKRDSATSLICGHRSQIKALLDRGFTAEQIVIQLAKINLNIEPETIRIVMRTTDNEGNRIVKNIKPRSKSRKTSIKVPGNASVYSGATTPEMQKKPPGNGLDDTESQQDDSKIKRYPITIDDDL